MPLSRQLEHFSLNRDSKALWEPIILSFHGPVPPLRVFYCERNTENLDLSSPFFFNLRDLNLGRDTLPISEFTLIVENMPFLERLTIETLVIMNSPHPRRTPIPRLRYLGCEDYNLFRSVELSQERKLVVFSENGKKITRLSRISSQGLSLSIPKIKTPGSVFMSP